MGTQTYAHETITDEKGRELVVKVEGLQKYFGKNHVLKGIDLEVYKGEVLVLIGPSGSGKSTFLRCLNFLEDPTVGEIRVGDVHVTCGSHGGGFKKDVHEIRMKCGMVFQEFNLFPHKDATENVTEGPILVKGLKKEEAIRKAHELLTKVGLGRAHGLLPEPALGRPEAARRHRPRHGDGPGAHALRRADQRPRPRAHRRGAQGHEGARRGRHDHDRGEPRDGLQP